MRTYEEANALLDKTIASLDSIGKRLEKTEQIAKANIDGFAETRKILDEHRKSSDEDFAKISKTLNEIVARDAERSEAWRKELEEHNVAWRKELEEHNVAWRREFEERNKRSDDDFAKIRKTLDNIAEDLNDVSSRSKGNGFSNGIVAEEFFMKITKDGLHVDGLGYLEQKNCNYIIYDKDKNKRAEFDIVFTDDAFIFIVEIKYRLDKEQVSFFTEKKKKGVDKGLNRLEIFEKYDGEWIGNRTVVTAFASLGAKEQVIEDFKKEGHYVLTREPNDTCRAFSPNDN